MTYENKLNIYAVLFFPFWNLSSEPTPGTTLPVLFCDGFFQWGLANYLPGLASNCDPPDFCLLNS
jgi:hypothetical protein